MDYEQGKIFSVVSFGVCLAIVCLVRHSLCCLSFKNSKHYSLLNLCLALDHLKMFGPILPVSAPGSIAGCTFLGLFLWPYRFTVSYNFRDARKGFLHILDKLPGPHKTIHPTFFFNPFLSVSHLMFCDGGSITKWNWALQLQFKEKF